MNTRGNFFMERNHINFKYIKIIVVCLSVLLQIAVFAAHDYEYDTIALLRAASIPSSNQTAYVKGYYAVNDSGGGMFVWDSSSSESDNGGTVIRPNSMPTTGRWKRTITGDMSVLFFGAKGNGSYDNVTVIRNAISAAYSNNRKLYIPGGLYLISGQLQLNYSNLYIYGDGQGLTTIKLMSAANCSIFLLYGADDPVKNITIKHMSLDWNGTCQTGGAASCIRMANADTITIRNISTDHATCVTNDVAGIGIFDSYGVTVENCDIGQADNNIIIQRSSYCNINSNSIHNNVQSEAISIYHPSGETPSLYNTVSNNIIYASRQGINIQRAMYTTVTGNMISYGAGGGIIVRGSYSTLSGNVLVADANQCALIFDGTYGNLYCDVKGMVIDLSGHQARAVDIASGSGYKPKYITIHGLKIYNSGSVTDNASHPGILFSGASHVLIDGFVISKSHGHGVSFTGESSNIKLKNGVIKECSRYGLYAGSSTLSRHNEFSNIDFIDNGSQSPGAYQGIIILSGNGGGYTASNLRCYNEDTSNQNTTTAYAMSAHQYKDITDQSSLASLVDEHCLFTTAATNSVSINQISTGYPGQVITIIGADGGNITFQNLNSCSGGLSLKSTPKVLADNECLRLIKCNGRWIEI